ncbi:MAG: hypothetical protein NUV45_15500 [Tepidanaerobacteraceae bacterium]|jgi:hypothetical protein|nr:hypothetical protein [Tepidanaerobacteraceae bacterium]
MRKILSLLLLLSLITFFMIYITSCYDLKKDAWKETVKEKLYAFQNSDGGFLKMTHLQALPLPRPLTKAYTY